MRAILGVKGVKFVESSSSPKEFLQIGLPMCSYSCYALDGNIVNQSIQFLTLHIYNIFWLTILQRLYLWLPRFHFFFSSSNWSNNYVRCVIEFDIKYVLYSLVKEFASYSFYFYYSVLVYACIFFWCILYCILEWFALDISAIWSYD